MSNKVADSIIQTLKNEGPFYLSEPSSMLVDYYKNIGTIFKIIVVYYKRKPYNIDKKIKFGGKIYDMYYKDYRLYISTSNSYGEVVVKVDSIFPDYYGELDYSDPEKRLIKSLTSWYTYKAMELENDIIGKYFD